MVRVEVLMCVPNVLSPLGEDVTLRLGVHLPVYCWVRRFLHRLAGWMSKVFYNRIQLWASWMQGPQRLPCGPVHNCDCRPGWGCVY